MTDTQTNAAPAAVAPQSFESWVSGRHRKRPRSRRGQLQAPSLARAAPQCSSLSCMSGGSLFVHVTKRCAKGRLGEDLLRNMLSMLCGANHPGPNSYERERTAPTPFL
jgi:hypothetical protein